MMPGGPVTAGGIGFASCRSLTDLPFSTSTPNDILLSDFARFHREGQSEVVDVRVHINAMVSLSG